jgi:hypothetical protein
MSDENKNDSAQAKRHTGLRDPIWQFIGAVLTAVTIFITIFLPLISGQKREISVKVSFSTILSTREDLVDSEIKIYYKDEEVKKVLVSEVTFINTGNSTILPNEYIEPIALKLNDCNILTASVVNSTPEWLKNSLRLTKINKTKIEINPNLFNSGENFSIRIFASDCSPGFFFTSRIIGIPQLNIIKDGPRFSWIGWLSIPLLAALLISFGYSLSGESTKIANRLSRLREAKIETEKRYLFEPERSQRIDRVNKEINQVNDLYKASDKSRQKVGNLVCVFIGFLLLVVFFLANQTIF